MPNGISCAYFAGKNLIYGQKEKNVFKQGIGWIQAERSINSAAEAGILKVGNASFLSKITNVVKKALYPLIIMSGIYNTAKADDKVKTGASQAGGIATMFLFEQLAEKGLNAAEKNLRETQAVKNNKKLALGLYILKGLAFVTASLTGYAAGSHIGETSVNNIRKRNEEQQTDLTEKVTTVDPFENGAVFENNPVDENENIFEDMKLE